MRAALAMPEPLFSIRFDHHIHSGTGEGLSAILARLETIVMAVNEVLDRLEGVLTRVEEGAGVDRAEYDRLKAERDDLRRQVDEGVLTPDQQQRLEAIEARLGQIDVIPDNADAGGDAGGDTDTEAGGDTGTDTGTEPTEGEPTA